MQRDLVQRLFTDRSQYPSSRAVEIVVQLQNEGRTTYILNTGARHEYEIRVRESRSRKVVWTWSKGKPRPTGSSIRLAPGELRERREFWDRRDDSGRRVPAGVYEVELIHVPFTGAMVTQIYLSERDQGDERPAPGNPLPPQQSPAPQIGNRVQATLQTDRSRTRTGETVRFTYTVVNAGPQPVRFSFPSSCQFDLEVRRRPEPNARYAAGALTVWQLSRDRFYTRAFTALTLAPGEKKVFTETWVVGTVAPGTYDLLGWLPTVGNKSAEAATNLTIL
jgi:hypothetical protein